MRAMELREGKVLYRWLSAVLVLVVFGLAFVQLWVLYRVVAWLAPGVLGAVAERPAVFAFWVALVALPIDLALITLGGGRYLWAALTTGEFPRHHARRSTPADAAKGVAATAVAASVVFLVVADPGDAVIWLLVLITAVVPPLLTHGLPVLGRLLLRRLRHRGHRPQHGVPEDQAHDPSPAG